MGIAIPHTLVPGMPKGMHASLFAKTEYTQHSGTEQVTGVDVHILKRNVVFFLVV